MIYITILFSISMFLGISAIMLAFWCIVTKKETLYKQKLKEFNERKITTEKNVEKIRRNFR